MATDASGKGKRRLDQLLVERGLVESRAQAQAMISAGKVVDEHGIILTKASLQAPHNKPLHLKEREHPWVSRGGMKLAEAIERFSITPAGQVIADIGASTGGFTHVLLHHGASKVYAIDVGHGQLHESLRQDRRVVNWEKTNARHLQAAQFAEDALDALVCDASFISLTLVLPAVMEMIRAGGWMVALIKPQFEVGKENIGKGGVVKDAALHQQACDGMAEWLQQQGWQVKGITPSPITGPKGNKEFLIHAVKE